jgi:hypothetical protein
MLVLGSTAFNQVRDDGKGLFCEGTSAGLQDQMLGAFAGTGHMHEGSLLVVPSQSHHTMVDDLGAIFKDKCAPDISFDYAVHTAQRMSLPSLSCNCRRSLLRVKFKHVSRSGLTEAAHHGAIITFPDCPLWNAGMHGSSHCSSLVA